MRFAVDVATAADIARGLKQLMITMDAVFKEFQLINNKQNQDPNPI